MFLTLCVRSYCIKNIFYRKKNILMKLGCFYILVSKDYRPFVHPAVQVGTPDPFPAPVAVADSV